METIVPEDSPLAAYLEGKGEGDHPDPSATSHPDTAQAPASFAPRGIPRPSRLFKRRAERVLQTAPVQKIRQAYAAVIKATLDGEDNGSFIEQFRYHLIASQLLDNTAGALPTSAVSDGNTAQSTTLHEISATTGGALTAALLAFAYVWLLNWAQKGFSTSASPWLRGILVVSSTVCLLAGLYFYATRRWLKSMRKQAISTTISFVTNLQAFDAASSSILTLIQEVEVVSRGYQVSNPLPPISRLEAAGQPRRCVRLRRNLHICYTSITPSLKEAIESIRSLVEADDVDRFLDIYDVRSEDVEEAWLSCHDEDEEEGQSLRGLRVHQASYGILRRLLLCCLLSMQATGRRSDASKWREATLQMRRIEEQCRGHSKKMNALLSDEDDMPSPTVPRRRVTLSLGGSSSSHHRLQSQVRRISTLSTGIRSLQAKLYLLRDESTRALSTPSSEMELGEVSASLREQYEALGSDLKALMDAWETGKQALAKDITRQSRRVSQSNLAFDGMSSARHSAGGSLASVDENGESRATRPPSMSDRLMQPPLSPPVTEDGSDDTGQDDEVFEALSSPRIREKSTLNREQRIAKMQEERDRLAMQREKREVGSNMVKELQAVIKMRPTPANRQHIHGRVTSV